MSDTTTPYLGLTKPAVGGSNDTWGDKDNADNDLLDANASAQDARLAALEARCTALENTPAVQEAVGSIKWWPTNLSFPPGFLICDGTWYAPSTYPLLFAVLSNAWGGDGVNNFAVPDLRGCVLVHMDEGTGRLQGQYGADRIGGTGGAAVVALTVAQMPSHSHGGATDGQGQHVHNFNAPAIQSPGWYIAGSSGTQIATEVSHTTDGAGFHAHNIATDAQGGSAAHTNCQPGALGYYVIKAVNL
jgi:microcystin-dependent protein